MSLNSSEGADALEEQATKILRHFGHLQRGESLPGQLQKDLIGRKFKIADLSDACRSIVEARSESTLDDRTLDDAIRYGLKNLSGTDISNRHIEEKDMHGFNLSDCNISRSEIIQVDLSGAVLQRARVRRTNFKKSALFRTDISTVYTGDSMKDLMQGSLRLNGEDVWNVRKTFTDGLGDCTDCELHNERVLGLTGSTAQSRQGVILFQEARPLGYLKLAGQPSFLALRTVQNRAGETIFWKSMVYALDIRDLLAKLGSHVISGSDTWGRVDVEDLSHPQMSQLARSNIRFIDRDNIFNALGPLAERIESGQEPLIDVFTSSSARESAD